MPPVLITTQQGNSNVAPFGEASAVTLDRRVVREMFPTGSKFQGTAVMTARWPQTPFRVAMNAGDLLLRKHAAGGSNQVKGLIGTRSLMYSSGGTASGDGASGNQKYVYDSSVYTRYKTLRTKQSTYNDSSFGGSNNSAYVFSVASRRFIRAS